MRLKNIPALILLFQLILNPFAPLAARANESAMSETTYEPGQESGAAEKKGLRFRLSEGAEAAERLYKDAPETYPRTDTPLPTHSQPLCPARRAGGSGRHERDEP